MKSNLRILSALAAICMLLACVLGCTSCTDELLTSMSELEGVLSQNLTETTEPTTTETEESTSDISQEPVTLPGEDTLSHDCEHAYGEWLEATPPGCETEGLCYRLCDICNGREEKAIDATGHTEEPMEPIAATCTLQGSKDGVQCAVCEEILVIPTVVLPIGHPSYNNGICIACGSPKNSAEGLAYLDIYNQSYGYEYLGTMENGEALQALYRELDTAVRAFHTDPSLEAREVKESDPIACTVNYGELGLSHEEAQAVWKTYRDDHPLYYWISNSVSYGETSKKLNLLAVPEFAHGSARLQTNQELYQSIAAYLSKIPESSTDYEIALLMYNALIDAIDYAYDENDQPETEAWAHSILGVFQGRGAVCEGYARAYQLLLNFNGVNCLFVTGESQGEAHAWNVIELDGEWYGVDATWDDNGSEGYSYFCISDAQFYATHTKDLPTDTGLNFLYEVPQLADYSIQWVDLYLNETLVGRYICIDLAFAAMTETDGSYTVRLLDGSNDALLHDVQRYHILGDLPSVGSLTLIGKHTMVSFTHYTATAVYLVNDVTLQCDLTLKSMFLMSETEVTVTQGTYEINTQYYSAIRDYITLK